MPTLETFATRFESIFDGAEAGVLAMKMGR